ncbi:MAG: tetratricopeptide repeat protein [Nitrospirae bacterium]|nr:tetratricopeptide repeat protein [Nitrospirota bacterium]
MKTLRIALLLLICLIISSCVSKEKANQAQAHYSLGFSAMNEGDYQNAFVKFQTAIKLDSRKKEFHNALGVVYFRLDKFVEAEASFRKALSKDSDYSEAYNNLCFLYYTKKKWEDAIKNCKKALKNPLYETPDKAYYDLGNIYYRLGMFDEAVEAFNDALRRQPNRYTAYYGLALSHNAKGNYGDASSALQKGIELDPRFKSDRTKAEAEFKAQNEKTLEESEKKDFKDLIEILNY